jgi:aromatic ring hydroxylase
MIRTDEQSKDSIRQRGVVYVNWECVKDAITHPQYKPLVDVVAGIYDMQHEAETISEMWSMSDGQEVLKFSESQKRSQKCQ